MEPKKDSHVEPLDRSPQREHELWHLRRSIRNHQLSLREIITGGHRLRGALGLSKLVPLGIVYETKRGISDSTGASTRTRRGAHCKSKLVPPESTGTSIG